ncbi:high frequency lysogenization protein HflD [Methylocystis iwaonis]|uniref:nickel/cobalt transporter n=1 Tax=Methylocystis iwaonis TaxID=2885079 RepID=UPI002E7BAD7C|nr:high frequency lysogenization protein HflD [Methylocystis iwaonis]
MTPRRLGFLAAAVLALAVCAIEPAAAQRHPFAIGAGETACGAGGFAGLMLAWQGKFNAELQSAARLLKTDPGAFLALAAASFAYGVFHAAGPGHGKAVLTSYMVANEVQLKRGLTLAALAALLQGVVAIALVLVAALVFRATAGQMTNAARVIEIASYLAIAALGAKLLWSKGSGLLAALRQPAVAVASASGSSRFLCEAIDDPSHTHGPSCGCAPDPATLSGPGFRWGDALATVFAAGLRPCSGAILILVFTLSQETLAAGAGAVLAMSAGTAVTTGALAAVAVYAKDLALRVSGGGARRMAIVARTAELLAALLVFGLGLALLAGMGASCSAS